MGLRPAWSTLFPPSPVPIARGDLYQAMAEAGSMVAPNTLPARSPKR